MKEEKNENGNEILKSSNRHKGTEGQKKIDKIVEKMNYVCEMGEH